MGNSSQTQTATKTPEPKVVKTPVKQQPAQKVVKVPIKTPDTTKASPTSKSKYIYVLELEDGCYYVGSTGNVDRRVAQHKSGNGAEWTKKHKVIKLMYFKEAVDKFSEDNETKLLMDRFGLNKVRGGTYCQIVLPKESIDAITKEMNHADGLCFKCKGNHLAIYCKGNSEKPRSTTQSVEKPRSTSQTCERCGRASHDIFACYANTNTKGAYLCSADTNQGRRCKKTVTVERGLCSTHKH